MFVRVGHWSSHTYARLSVKDFVEEFCGWQPLCELINHAESGRNRAFLACLFLTGGRVGEVLSLRKENFELRRRERVLIVRGMPLLKRYKKTAEQVDVSGKKHWVTEKVQATRKPFPILLREPLTPILLAWIEQSKDLLFPSPYKHGEPLSRFWAYHFIRSLDKTLPLELKQKLGLDKPFIKNGKLVADKLHLWLHWFRSQRASQLVSDFGFEVADLVDYFSWEHYGTALTYARRGWKGLASKMRKAKLNA
ncbi:site-specific integrase [Candidatus Bathyarchaeota archaeon]|nr:site-specific integrase [Candidatus Bathyarchaeota archaeon]